MSDGASRAVYGKSSKSGGGLNETENAITKLSSTPIIHRGVVIQTLCDPSLRLDETPEGLLKGQEKLYYKAPRNSVICRLITDGSSEDVDQDLICYPFFSSHLSMPIKPGELVWVFRELPIAPKGAGTYYWLSRVPRDLFVPSDELDAVAALVILEDYLQKKLRWVGPPPFKIDS